MRRGFATKDRDSCSLMVPRSTAGIPGRKPPLCGWRFTAGIRFASWAPATCCWNGETCRALRICRLFRSDRRQASLGGNPRYVAGGLPLVSDSHRGHQQLAAGTEKRAGLYGSADYSDLIDGRHPWAETPAMWLEVYRWYQIRIVGTSNLLLERRNVPRFTDLQTISRTREPFADGVSIPDSSEPVFWRMQCPLTSTGKIRSVLLRIPEVTMRLSDRRDRGETFRVVVPVLSSPSLGNYLPSTLAEFAAIFSSDETPGFYVKRLTFGGPGLPYYGNCEVELLRPANLIEMR